LGRRCAFSYIAGNLTLMDKLFTKLQYINFEPGEFTDEKWRTKDELFELIETFPWEKQREHILIDYTNAGIVIQTNTNHLKLALYYYGKFVLYFFDGGRLYSKSFMGYKEAYPCIAQYFDKGFVELSVFKKENLLFTHISKHFISKDFRYFINKKRIREFFVLTSFYNFIIFLFILFAGVVESIEMDVAVSLCTVLTPLLLFGAILNSFLFFNYYRFMKNKMLILSKGNDDFWYGDIGNIKLYSKKDIERVIVVCSKNPKSYKDGFWSEFAIYKIHFSNNTYPIAFTSLLINKTDFKNKFNKSLQKEEQKMLPFFTELDAE
jgi:hypothetical protein